MKTNKLIYHGEMPIKMFNRLNKMDDKTYQIK